jgi:hypothetical protein
MAYIGKSPSGTGVRSRFYYTQTSGGGTSISGTDDNSKTLTFTDGEYIDVFLNGVLLVAGTDYNTSTANTISGLAALANGDVVEVVVYDIFTVADTVSASQGGTFNGGVTMSDGLTVDDDGATALTVDRASSEGTVVDLQKDGTTFGTLGVDGSDLVIDGPSGHTGLRMTTAGLLPRQNSAIIDNTIQLGSAAYRYKDLYLGGNLYIGGTGSANALDDYEVGTFSPTFQQGISVTSYSAQNGRYTKTGNLVTAQIDLDVNVGSANTSHVFIGGLPFTSFDGAPYGGGFISYNGGWYNANFSFLVIANSTYLATYRQSDGGAVGGNDLTNFNGTIRLTAIYIAA